MSRDRDEFFRRRKGRKKKRGEAIRQPEPDRYLIVTEGEETETNYFEGMKRKINAQYANRITQIRIDIEGTGRNTNSLVHFVEKIMNRSVNPYSRIWVVFDKDDFSDDQFNSAIAQAESKGYQVGWTNEAFELWFLLHFEYLNSGISREQYIEKLTGYLSSRGVLKKGDKYDKNMAYIYEILMEHGDMERAIGNCKKLIEMHEANGEHSYARMNPASTVYKLVEELKEYL